MLAVTGVRAVRLAAGEALGAHGERLWFGWAYRHPELASQLARARTELRPGEAIHLAVPPGRYEARWLRVMVRYHLPEQTLAGIHEVAPAPEPPPGVTGVVLDAGGRVEVRRGGGRSAGADATVAAPGGGESESGRPGPATGAGAMEGGAAGAENEP